MTSRISSLAFLFCLPFLPLHAAASVLDFETITTTSPGTSVPDGYGGLNWNFFYVMDKEADTSVWNGYHNGTTSGNYSAFNWGNANATFWSDQPFTLVSMQVSKPHAFGDAHFIGYRNGEIAYRLDIPVGPTGSTLVQFNWSDITSVRMLGDPGTYHTVIDDVVISQVPEPNRVIMMLAGAVMVFAGLLRQRK